MSDWAERLRALVPPGERGIAQRQSDAVIAAQVWEQIWEKLEREHEITEYLLMRDASRPR